MDCQDFQLLISKSLDGELDAASLERLREHLSACPDCALVARDFESMDAELGPLVRGVTDDDELASRVRHNVPTTTARPRIGPAPLQWFLPALAAAACLALAILIAGLREHRPGASPTRAARRPRSLEVAAEVLHDHTSLGPGGIPAHTASHRLRRTRYFHTDKGDVSISADRDARLVHTCAMEAY